MERKDRNAVALGRKGGKASAAQGGGNLKQWANSLTPKELSAVRRRAALARWAKRDEERRDGGRANEG